MLSFQRGSTDEEMKKARDFGNDPRTILENVQKTKDQWVKDITPASARALAPEYLSAKYEVLRTGKLVGDARKAFFVLIGELDRRSRGKTLAVSFNDGTKKTATIEGIDVSKGVMAEKDLPLKLVFADGTRTALSWNQTLEVQRVPATKVVVEEEKEELADKKVFTEERIAAGIARNKGGVVESKKRVASPDKKEQRLLELNAEWKGKTVMRLNENEEKTHWYVDGVIGTPEGAEVLLVGFAKGKKTTKKEEIGDFILKNRYSETHDTDRLAQEAQARFARRIGTARDTIHWTAADKMVREFKIVGIVPGSDDAPVLLQDSQGGKPFPVAALVLDGHEKLAAALVGVDAVSKVEKIQKPASPEEPYNDGRHVVKIHAVAGDVSQGLAARSRDTGESRLHREPKETNYFTRAWKYIFSEGARQLSIAKSRGEKLSARDVYAGEGLTKAESDAQNMAIVERIKDETEEMLHKEGKNAEARKKFGDTPAEAAVKRSLDGLIREYVKGVMTPGELNAQKDAIFAQARKLAGDAKGEGVMYVDNLEAIAEQVKKASKIAGGLKNLDLDIEFTIGRAKIGARTERDRSRIDAALDTLSTYGASGALGSGVARVFHNEIAVSLGTLAGLGVVAKSIGLGKLKLLSAGLSSGLSGMFSYWKEKEMLNQERSLTERQAAEGNIMKRDESAASQAQRKAELEQKAQLEAQRDALPWHKVMEKLRLNKRIAELDNAGQPRRELMEQYSLSRVRSTDALTTMKYGLDGTALRAGTDFASATRILTHIEARVRLSNKNNVDFIQYSKPALIEQERNDIEVTRATLKRALRNAFAVDTTIDKATYPTFDDYYNAMYALEDRGNVDAPATDLEKAQQVSAKKFAEYTHRQGKESAKKTIILGAIFGAAFQEIAAGFQDHVTGLWDEMMGNHVAGAETTLLATPIEWLRNYMGAGVPTGVVDHSHIEQIGSNLVSLSHNTAILHQADGTDALVNTATGKIIVPDVHAPNGILDAATKQACLDAGVAVHESEVVTNSVSNLTKIISMTDWFKEHLIHPIIAVRHWMGNDTPMHWNADHTKLLGADFNEIELKAAQTASGVRSWFDTNGNALWRIPGMTAEGSFQGGHHADVIAALKTGHAELWITPDSHYPDHIIRVPFNAHGVATIPGGSSQVDLLYRVVNGKMEFVGDRAEVVITGANNNVDVLATYLGLDSAQPTLVENVGKAVTHHVTSLVNSPESFSSPEMAPFYPIPVKGRAPLEKVGWKKSLEYALYQGGKTDPELEKAFEKHRSERLKKDPKVKLDSQLEIAEYFKHSPKEHVKVVTEMAKDLGEMGRDVKLSICIPAAGHQEGKQIYESLKNYTYQTVPRNEFEIVVFVNRPEKDPKTGKKILPDETMTEIERFKNDYPDMQVRVVERVLPVKDARIAYVRKLLNDAVALRQLTRRAPAPRDLIMVSNDADNKGIAPEYIANFIRKFDVDSDVDGMLGQLDWDPEAYVKFPLVHVGTRLFQYLNAIGRERSGRMVSSGANFAFRAGMYAAIGGYRDEIQDGGEDVALGRAIVAARKDHEAIQFAGARVSRVYTSARRAIDALRSGVAPIHQWKKGFSAFDDEIRKMSMDTDEIPNYFDPVVVARLQVGLESVINQTIDTYEEGEIRAEGQGLGKDAPGFYKKALGWMGIQYRIDENNKVVITNIDQFVEQLKDYQTVAVPMRDAKAGKNNAPFKAARKQIRERRIAIPTAEEARKAADAHSRVNLFMSVLRKTEPLFLDVPDVEVTQKRIDDSINNIVYPSILSEQSSEFRDSVEASGKGETPLTESFTLSRDVVLSDQETGKVFGGKTQSGVLIVGKESETALTTNETEQYLIGNKYYPPNILLPFQTRKEGGKTLRIYEAGKTDLEHLLEERKVLPLKQALGIMFRVCDGVRALHDMEIVHTDIAPSNIILWDDDVRLGDLDAAQIQRGKFSYSRIGGQGNRFVTPPELLEQKDAVSFDRTVDVYEIAASLFRMVEGRFPYDIESTAERRKSVEERTKDYFELHRSGNIVFSEKTPEDLQKVLRKAMDPLPKNRYQSMEDFMIDLEKMYRTVG